MHHPHGHLVCRHQRCGIDCMLGCFQQLSRCECGNQHRYASGPTTTSREYGVHSSRKRMRARKQSLGARRFVFPPSLRLEGAVPVLGTGGAEKIRWRPRPFGCRGGGRVRVALRRAPRAGEARAPTLQGEPAHRPALPRLPRAHRPSGQLPSPLFFPKLNSMSGG